MNVQNLFQGKPSYLMLMAALFLAVADFGCGGGYGSSAGGNGGENGGGSGGSSVVSMQGSWEIVFQSTVTQNKYTVLEANLTQTGTHVFAGAPSAVLYQSMGRGPASFSLKASKLGGECDSDGSDEVTVDATLTNIAATSETVTLTLTETGNLGTAVTTASSSSDGTQVSGTYSTPRLATGRKTITERLAAISTQGAYTIFIPDRSTAVPTPS